MAFYFDYRETAGSKPTQEVIVIETEEMATLVIAEERRNVYQVSIVSFGEKREWLVDEIVRLAFGYLREIV